jgi:hypothetical protein
MVATILFHHHHHPNPPPITEDVNSSSSSDDSEDTNVAKDVTTTMTGEVEEPEEAVVLNTDRLQLLQQTLSLAPMIMRMMMMMIPWILFQWRTRTNKIRIRQH